MNPVEWKALEQQVLRVAQSFNFRFDQRLISCFDLCTHFMTRFVYDSFATQKNSQQYPEHLFLRGLLLSQCCYADSLRSACLSFRSYISKKHRPTSKLHEIFVCYLRVTTVAWSSSDDNAVGICLCFQFREWRDVFTLCGIFRIWGCERLSDSIFELHAGRSLQSSVALSSLVFTRCMPRDSITVIQRCRLRLQCLYS